MTENRFRYISLCSIAFWINMWTDHVFWCLIFYVGATKVLSEGEQCVASHKIFTEINLKYKICSERNKLLENFCFYCNDLHKNVLLAYNELSTIKFTSTNNETKSCSDLLNKEERLNSVLVRYESGKCGMCVWKEENNKNDWLLLSRGRYRVHKTQVI